MSEQQRERSFAFDWSLKVWGWIGLGTVVLSLALVGFNLWNYVYEAKRDLGNFGDFLGGVLTPLLTFLTFVGLLQSIHLQREELKATREELAASARAQEEQAEYMKKQQELSVNSEGISLVVNMLNMINNYRSAEFVTYNGGRQRGFDEIIVSFVIDSENFIENKKKFTDYLSSMREFIVCIDGFVNRYGSVIGMVVNDRQRTVIYFSIKAHEANFFRKYNTLSEKYKDLLKSDTTKAHLETIVAFLDEQDRLTQSTP